MLGQLSAFNSLGRRGTAGEQAECALAVVV